MGASLTSLDDFNHQGHRFEWRHWEGRTRIMCGRCGIFGHLRRTLRSGDTIQVLICCIPEGQKDDFDYYAADRSGMP